ncbi:hypothetical protein ONZ45_g2629 [Pleurotus djamor]|nr:hypothetical protein ONZ45_g2629 [Pleurotus djamor]
MRLPRRVPWSSLEELEQVCNWIFFEDSSVLAIQRLSAWKAITALPHALESTLALLVVTQQDNVGASTSSYLSLRQSYAAALIRLVNGLVDPLQLGVYARSIATIAAQLGLPPWLVELRHAATHEDLPSLELLRQATTESLGWILNNYFIPTLNPTSTTDSQRKPLRPLTPLLKRYKTLVKSTVRDASLRTRYKHDILSVLKEVEGWVTEAKVAANITIGGLDPTQEDISDDEIDPRERWALEQLGDVLLEKGILVPLAKKKRLFPDDAFLPPSPSVALWSPLLSHLFEHHPDLPLILCEKIALTLNSMPSSSTSFDECLARWVIWVVNQIELGDPDYATQLRRNVYVTLFQSAMPAPDSATQATKTYAIFDIFLAVPDLTANRVSSLLHALSECDSELSAAYAILHTTPPMKGSSSVWNADDLSVMTRRLEILTSSTDVYDTAATESLDRPVDEDVSARLVAPGWRLTDKHSGWKPTPIGVYCPTT